METNVYLIRHAQSHPTVDLQLPEWPLSPVGFDQAESLCDLLEPLEIEVLLSSPYPRCLQTIQPFANRAGLEVVVEDDLRERTVVNELVDNFDQIWRQSWDDFNFVPPGGESSFDAQRRFVAAVNDILAGYPRKTIGIVTHGNVTGLFLNHIDQTFGREEAEALKNPDVLRIVAGDRINWDREFRLPGLESIAIDQDETPVQRQR